MAACSRLPKHRRVLVGVLRVIFIVHELGEVLLPNPTNGAGVIVLVLGEPELSFDSNDVEYLTRNVREVGIASFRPCSLDLEVE